MKRVVAVHASPQGHWVGDGFPVRSLFSYDGLGAALSPFLLLDYAGAVHGCTIEFLRGLTDEDLDRVVDRRWDPPVTLGVRLISVLSDDLQHVGQAAYVRGLLSGG